MNDAAERQRRAAARQHWVGGLVASAEDRPPVGATVLQRLEMLSEISRRSWALTRQPIPLYARDEIPGQIFRGIVLK